MDQVKHHLTGGALTIEPVHPDNPGDGVSITVSIPDAGRGREAIVGQRNLLHLADDMSEVLFAAAEVDRFFACEANDEDCIRIHGGGVGLSLAVEYGSDAKIMGWVWAGRNEALDIIADLLRFARWKKEDAA